MEWFKEWVERTPLFVKINMIWSIFILIALIGSLIVCFTKGFFITLGVLLFASGLACIFSFIDDVFW